MKKILFICPYPEGVAAGQRLKFEPHFPAFRDAGYEITVHSFMSMRLWNIASIKGRTFQKIFWTLAGLLRRIYLITSIRKYDCIYIHMNVFPFGPPILEKIYLLLAKRVIFDLEDNIFTKEHGSVNFLASILKSTNKIAFLVAASDQVICSSPDLQKTCSEISKKNNVTFIPPTLEATRFIPKDKKHAEQNEITVGWTGTFSSKNFLNQIMPELENLYKKQKFKLMVIGNFEMKNENLNLEVVQWDAKEEIDQLHCFDIGIYPLPENDWISGKSGLKALQYMAIGIPPVCSAVGNVLNFIEHGKDGILIYNNSDWVNSLANLIRDNKQRSEIGSNARAKFLTDFSQEAICKKYLSVIGDKIK